MSAIKVNGTWKQVSSIKIKKDGAWQEHSAVYARLEGAWHLIDLGAEPLDPAYHVWKAYADDELGTGITLDPTNKHYLGLATGQRSETPDLSDPSVFDWSLIKGEDGEGVDQTVLDQIQTTIDGNTNRVSTLENTTATNANRLSTVETETGETNTRVSSLETTTAEQGSRLSTVETETGETNTRVSSLETTSAEQGSRLSSVELDAGGTKNRVSSLETASTAQAERLSTVETNAGNTQNRVSSLEMTTSSHASRISSVEVKSNANASKVGVLETATTDNASRIETVKVQQDNAVAAAIDTAKAYTDTETGVLKAERVIKADANGKVSGIHLLANGSGADAGGKMYFQADEIAIVPPNWNAGTEADKSQFPFYFSEDRKFMYLDEATIKRLSAETIDSGSLAVDGLTLLTSNLSLPAGAIREHMLDPSFKDGIVRVNPDGEKLGGSVIESVTGITANRDITTAALKSGGNTQDLNISITGPNIEELVSVSFDLQVLRNGTAMALSNGSTTVHVSTKQEVYNTGPGGGERGRTSLSFTEALKLFNPTSGTSYTFTLRISNYTRDDGHNYAPRIALSLSVSEPIVSSGGFITDVRWSEVKEQPSFVGLDTVGSSSYPRLILSNNPGTSSVWLRVNSSSGGILPYSNGGSKLGTNGWRFAEVHSVNFFENGARLTDKYLGKTATAADSAKLGGLNLNSSSRNNQANRVMRTDSNGYAQFGWINTISGGASGAIDRIYCSQDSYLRYLTPASFAANMSAHLVTAGRVLTDVPAGAKFTDTNTWRPISDSATSTSSSTSASLTAVKTAYDKGVQALGVANSHNHNGLYYTESEVRTFLNRSYVYNHTAYNLAVGWYTIATNTGDRASARFGIWDTNSSDHQAVTFYAAHHFGTDGSNTLTVLDNSYFGGSPFRHIRIKDGGTYDGAALQVYIEDPTNNVHCAILGDNFQASGWVLCDWVADGTTPPNVSNYPSFGERSRVDLNQIAQGGFATTGEIYCGGDRTLQRVFHGGYHPTADRWTMARTLSLSGDVTGSVQIDGSSDRTLAVTVKNDSHSHHSLIGLDNVARYGTTSLQFAQFSGVGGTGTNGAALSNPSNGWYNHIVMNHGNNAGYYTDIATDLHRDAAFIKRVEAGTHHSWQRIFTDVYHPNADRWTSARTISLSGDASGAVSIDGSGNVTLPVAVKDDSHNHSQVYIPDTRGAARAPSYYPDRYVSFDFQQNTNTGAGDAMWHVVQTVAKWSSYASSHSQQQLAFTGSNLKHREATSDSSWGAWKKIWDTGNVGLDSNIWGGITSRSPHGYIDIGPANTSYAHIYTDRPSFYFNKVLYAGSHATGGVGSRVMTWDDFTYQDNPPAGLEGVINASWIQAGAIRGHHIQVSTTGTETGNKSGVKIELNPLGTSPFSISDKATGENLFSVQLVEGQPKATVNGFAGENFVSNPAAVSSEVKRAINPYYMGESSPQSDTSGTAMSSGTSFSLPTVQVNGGLVMVSFKLGNSLASSSYATYGYSADPSWRVRVYRNAVSGAPLFDKTYSGNAGGYIEQEPGTPYSERSYSRISIEDGFVDQYAPASEVYVLRVDRIAGSNTNLARNLFKAASPNIKINDLSYSSSSSNNGSWVDKDTGFTVKTGRVYVSGNNSANVYFRQAFSTIYTATCNSTSANVGYSVTGSVSTLASSYIRITNHDGGQSDYINWIAVGYTQV